MFAVLYQTGKQISIPSWDLQYHVSSVSSFKLPGWQVYLKSLQKLSPLHYYPASSPRDFKDAMDYCYLEIGSDLIIA